MLEDMTCGSQGLSQTLFLCTTYITVAMTPLSVSACPMSHQCVGGCDMRQSWVEGVFIYVYYIQYSVAMTPLSVFECPMSHHFVIGCDM